MTNRNNSALGFNEAVHTQPQVLCCFNHQLLPEGAGYYDVARAFLSRAWEFPVSQYNAAITTLVDWDGLAARLLPGQHDVVQEYLKSYGCDIPEEKMLTR